MAKAYLGKISALVTANTSDFNSKLNASAKEVGSFARAMQSQISRAESSATASLRNIYTESQKVSRALQAAASQRLQFKGYDTKTFESLTRAIDQFKSLQAAAVAVNEPLAGAARSVERLSASVQQSFDPALKRAQKSAEYLNSALARGGVVGEQSFERIRQRAIAAAEAANRLAEASQLASGGPRGRELAFAAPRVRDALSASADVRQRAANAPAVALEGGRVSSDVQKLVALDNLIQKRRAEIESGTILNIDTTQARASLENLLAVAKRVREQVNSAIGGGPDGETATLINRARAQREFYAESERLQAQSAADSAAPLINRARAEREYYEESKRLANQAAADAAAPLIARARAEREFYEESERLQRQAAQDAAAPLIARARAEREFYEESERLQNQSAADAAAPLIARARAEREFYAESERLQAQSAADAAAPLINRARAEREYYEESKRLANQAAADAAAPLIARAQAERDFYEESERLAKQAASDEATLLSRRARAQQEFEEERRRRDAVAAADAAEEIAPAINRGRAQRESAIDFGLDLDAPARQVELVRTSITSLKSQIDSLPLGFRTRFIPAIAEAQNQLEALAATPGATEEAIERLRLRVVQLGNEASTAASRLQLIDSVLRGFGGAGVEGITLGLDSRVVQGFTSQLQVLQGVIAGVAGAARNDLAAAFEGVRQSIVSAMNDGTIATRATQESIDASIQSLARMAATASNQNVGRVLTQVARAGDIGRRGLDRFALAAQQAGFAIDDFFSATGGIDQRIRAVSNNITQLAFIIGSTKGLFIGLSVVIGSQVVLAISKWINSGRTLEDNSKALNDTLARQKSLVEALAESFRALGDSLTQGTLSGQASDARDFAESLNRARKARKDLNDEGVLQNDPAVRRERANQARIERELQNAGDQGTVVQLQAQLEESRRRERARRGVLVQPAPGANEVEDVLRRRAPNPFRRNVPDLADGGELSALRERRAALEAPLERLREIISEGPSFFDGGFRFNAASQSFDEINSLAARLDSAISDAVDGIADDLANSARGPAATIRNAQQEVAAAIEAGVPGARRLGVLVDQVGNEFQDAIKALEAAVAITDPAERERAIADARARLDGVRGRRSDIEARTDSVRRERTLNPERNIDAVLSRTQSEVDRIGAPANALRSQLRELQFQRDTVSAQLEATPADPVLIRAEQELTRALISLEGAVGDLSFDAAEESRLRGDPERGRTLSMTPAERAAEEIQQGLNDIQARFQAVAENVTGLVDTAGMEEAQARFMEDMVRQFAPMITGMADSVRNAVMQGPSRAALNASDVTTTQGQQELNRLLRGDDPAREVDLVALQREANRLLEVIAKKGAPVAD
jgi:hypothetical protein